MLLGALPALSQSPATPETPETGGRVILVLPFDNRTGQTNLAWVGDSFTSTPNRNPTSPPGSGGHFLAPP